MIRIVLLRRFYLHVSVFVMRICLNNLIPNASHRLFLIRMHTNKKNFFNLLAIRMLFELETLFCYEINPSSIQWLELIQDICLNLLMGSNNQILLKTIISHVSIYLIEAEIEKTRMVLWLKKIGQNIWKLSKKNVKCRLLGWPGFFFNIFLLD